MKIVILVAFICYILSLILHSEKAKEFDVDPMVNHQKLAEWRRIFTPFVWGFILISSLLIQIIF